MMWPTPKGSSWSPPQNVTSNPARCWNWQLPINQARDSGASILAGIVDKVKADW
jgi:hypothetical protein